MMIFILGGMQFILDVVATLCHSRSTTMNIAINDNTKTISTYTVNIEMLATSQQ